MVTAKANTNGAYTKLAIVDGTAHIAKRRTTMKTSLILIFLLLLSACSPVDPRTNVERARDDMAACKEIGGTPTLRYGVLGVFVICEPSSEDIVP